MIKRPAAIVCLWLFGQASCWPALAQGPEQQPSEAAVPAAVEEAAARLLAATVTIRVSPPPTGVLGLPLPSRRDTAAAEEVTVCSGVSLGGGLMVTFASAPADSRFRVTLPDGEQAEARLRVVDHYSGLSLLAIDKPDLAGLEQADELPRIGGAVVTAAAAGIERPVVSLGILSATERSLGGTGLPPLLQCDVRTTDTSSGAPVVDRAGRLVGIVAATAQGERAGWTYAVPARHVERLLRARSDAGLVVLKRRRPSVGLTMGPGEREGSVEVERVEPGGPAAKAGIRPRDLVLEADGRKIRSAYQAVDLILKKQPGDKVELVIQHDGQTRVVALTLAGGTVVPEAPRVAGEAGIHIGPQLSVRAGGRKGIEVRKSSGVEEVAVEPESSPGRILEDEISLLGAQLAAFEQVIDRLQAELRRRDERQAQTEAKLKALAVELRELRKEKAGQDD